MITLKQEKEVRAGLRSNLPGTVIAGKAGVSTDAVYAVRKMIEIVDSILPSIRKNIRDSLEVGLPISVIESRHCVPREWVNAVRRYHYIQPFRLADRQKVCPVCKSVRVVEKVFLGPKLEGSQVRGLVSGEDIEKMFGVCEDLAAMGSSGLSVNPLVYRLVEIAKSIVKGVNVRTKEKNSSIGQGPRGNSFQVAFEQKLDGEPA